VVGLVRWLGRDGPAVDHLAVASFDLESDDAFASPLSRVVHGARPVAAARVAARGGAGGHLELAQLAARHYAQRRMADQGAPPFRSNLCPIIDVMFTTKFIVHDVHDAELGSSGGRDAAFQNLTPEEQKAFLIAPGIVAVPSRRLAASQLAPPAYAYADWQAMT
jgi:hypothetical protein